MDKPFFRQLFRSELETPVFVEGLPGFGNVGKIAVRRLIEFTHAKRFSELYSPFFPDYIMVNKKGIFRLPRYEFYVSSTQKHNLLILTGDVQPSLNDVTAHYELCGEILRFAEKCGCKFVVTIGGVPTSSPEKEVYVAATSTKLAAKIAGEDALIYGKGRIMGATGLLLGLA
ncbi:MAG: PAC2 family protein, partial [Thermoproteota archaeon]|nr:PAC2 family protein [Thermoproteota archaeon]